MRDARTMSKRFPPLEAAMWEVLVPVFIAPVLSKVEPFPARVFVKGGLNQREQPPIQTFQKGCDENRLPESFRPRRTPRQGKLWGRSAKLNWLNSQRACRDCGENAAQL